MKNLCLSLFFLLMVTACTQPQSNRVDFDMNSFPKEWIKLTKQNNRMVVYTACDAGNLLLTLHKKDSTFGILLHGQQEEYEFDVTKAEQTTQDTLTIQTQWKGTNKQQIFFFTWVDSAKGVGKWTSYFPEGQSSSFMFVTADKQNSFPQIKQPCKECYGEECDEISE